MVMRSKHKLFETLLILAYLFFGVAIAWSQDEAELVRGAKKEGKVMFWSAMRVEDNQALVEGFQTKYPFIKVDVFRASSEKLVNRAVTESLAGKMTADVLNGFALKALQNRGMLQAYRSPEAAHIRRGSKTLKITGYLYTMAITPSVTTQSLSHRLTRRKTGRIFFIHDGKGGL